MVNFRLINGFKSCLSLMLVLALAQGCQPPEQVPDDVDIIIIGDTGHRMLNQGAGGYLSWTSVFAGKTVKNLSVSGSDTHALMAQLTDSSETYRNSYIPKTVLLNIGVSNASSYSPKDSTNNYEVFFDAVQNDVIAGGDNLATIVSTIKTIWPATHVVIVNPYPADWNYAERVFLNEWAAFNSAATGLASQNRVSFVDVHEGLTSIFFDETDKSFKQLSMIDPQLDLTDWRDWTSADEYQRYSDLFASTHSDSFLLNPLGYMIYIKSLECTVNAILNNSGGQCTSVSADDVNTLYHSIVDHDVVLLGDSVLDGFLVTRYGLEPWAAVFPDYKVKNLSRPSAGTYLLDRHINENFDAFSTYYNPRLVVLNIGVNNTKSDTNKYPDNEFYDFFIDVQQDVVSGIFGLPTISEIIGKIYSMWPDTQILLVNPYPKLGTYEERVYVSNWSLFNSHAEDLAATDSELTFLNGHYAFSSIFYDYGTHQFIPLDPTLSVDQWSSWTLEGAYTEYGTLFATTHNDAVHLNDKGYTIYAALLDCPIKQLLSNANLDCSAPITHEDANDVLGLMFP